jgi:hypothetical protein
MTGTDMSDFDSSAAVNQSRADKLATLMAAGGECARLWRPDELAAIFRHQMSAPMLVDLGAFDDRAAAQLRLRSEAQSLLLKSFADLFQHPTPLVELLQLVKNFARANMDQPESALPGEIAAVLYYSSIAAALVRLNTRITQLPDADLERGLAWAGGQPWLDEPTRGLLAGALAKVAGGRKGTGT